MNRTRSSRLQTASPAPCAHEVSVDQVDRRRKLGLKEKIRRIEACVATPPRSVWPLRRELRRTNLGDRLHARHEPNRLWESETSSTWILGGCSSSSASMTSTPKNHRLVNARTSKRARTRRRWHGHSARSAGSSLRSRLPIYERPTAACQRVGNRSLRASATARDKTLAETVLAPPRKNSSNARFTTRLHRCASSGECFYKPRRRQDSQRSTCSAPCFNYEQQATQRPSRLLRAQHVNQNASPRCELA